MKFEENPLAKSARKWVLALGIIDGIGVISSIVGIFTLISLKSSDYASIRALGEMGEELIAIYQAQSTPINLIIQILLTLGQLVGVILLFRGASNIKKGLLMDKTAFYLLLGILVISNVFSFSIGILEFVPLTIISLGISLLLVLIPFWKVNKYNNSLEDKE